MPRIDLPDAPIEIAPDDPMEVQLDKLKDNTTTLWDKYDELIGENSPIYQNLQEIYNVDMTVGGGGGGGGVGPGTANRISMFTAPNAVGDSIITQAGMAGIDIGGWLSVSSYLLMGGNIRLNGNWLSNDGGNEGVAVDNAGNVTCSNNLIVTGTTDAQGGVFDSAGALELQADANQNINMFSGAAAVETPLLQIYGWAAFGALRSLQISCGSVGDDQSYFNGTSTYGFNGDLIVYGNGIFDASAGNWILSDGALNTTLGGALNVTLDLTVTGNNILDAAGAWIDSDGAGNTTINGTLTGASPWIVTGINGIDYNPGGDIDCDLITVGVTDAPRIWWDESEDQFAATKGLNLLDDSQTEGFSIRHSNLTQGIGIGYNTILKIATAATSHISLLAKGGSGQIWLGHDTPETGIRIIPDNVTNTIWFGNQTVHISADTGNDIYIGRTSATATGIGINTTTGNLTVGGDVTVNGNNILDAAGAWIDSDGAGNTTAQGNLTTTGHLGVDIAAATDRTLYVSDTALSTITTYYNIHSVLTKTAGVTDAGDEIYGIYAETALNQNGGVIGELWGITSITTLTDGTVSDDMRGMNVLVDGNGGTVSGDIAGVYIDVDLEAAMAAASGFVDGIFINMDLDEDPAFGGTGIRMNLLSNMDYGIYQGGAGVINYFQGDMHFDREIILQTSARTDLVTGAATWLAADGAQDTMEGFSWVDLGATAANNWYSLSNLAHGQVLHFLNTGTATAYVGAAGSGTFNFIVSAGYGACAVYDANNGSANGWLYAGTQ